jgi:predicted negative regulator of RcsB-dependent stress response
MDFYHAQISADATDDPYSEGSTPTFSSEEAKYQAAAKEFSSVASRRGHAKISIIARYYLGLTQLQIGKEKDALTNLESVSANSRNRTLGFLAKKAIAAHYFKSGNYSEAGGILESIIKDPQCDLPKDDLNLMLAKALAAQGKHDEAITILTEATSQGPGSGLIRQQLAEELDRLQRTAKTELGREPTIP